MADSDRRGTWAIIIVVLLLLFLLLSRCSGSNGSSRVGAVPNSAGPAEPAPAATAPANQGNDNDDSNDDDDNDDDDAVDEGAQAAGFGTLTVDGKPLLPLRDADGVGRNGNLSGLSGKRAVANSARVLTVPADEGFWLGTSNTDRVWVQLTGLPPESPYTVLPGDTVSFTGRISPNGRDFARAVGVTRAEGAAKLTAQRQHVNVAKRGLSLRHP
jgi:hypothetical protein